MLASQSDGTLHAELAMKLALLGDIHANLPALEAVLADIDARSDIHTVLHMGDLVGYGPWPNEIVALIWERRIPGVAGNYDSTVATGHKHCGCRYENSRQEELSHRSYQWTLGRVWAETKRFLGSLPFRLDVRPGGGHASGAQLILFHGAPTRNTLYLDADRPDDFLATMARKAAAREGDLLAFGHTHIPWRREVDGVHFLNVGSVGKPKDGDWRAAYALVEFDDGESPTSEIVRVEYDLDRIAVAIRESGLPEEFSQLLRTGGHLDETPSADDLTNL
ncbi:MAG TPA: metallophosphoesterase family protein [Gemmatimonadota bacterium]|nr:metallophosphoesterase family protein [Gemmatimonadota bacterium]